MGWTPDARRTHIDRARVVFRVGNELWQCLGREQRVHHHNSRAVAVEARDRSEVGSQTEAEIIVKSRVNRTGRTDRKKHVAVRRCPDDSLRSEVASSAYP